MTILRPAEGPLEPLNCGRARRGEAHASHEFLIQLEDDSPECGDFLCPGLVFVEDCHDYYEVEIGMICCVCSKPVKAKWSGIGCPCGHAWYCE